MVISWRFLQFLDIKHQNIKDAFSTLIMMMVCGQGVLTPSWRTVVRHPLAGVRRECALACEDQVENCTVLYNVL